MTNRRGKRLTRWATAGAACAGMFVSGCGKGGDGPAVEIDSNGISAMLETAEPVRIAHNARVERLGVLWSRGIVAFRYRDAEGKLRDDQGNANVQLILPDRFAMRIHKVGETLLWIGCDAERYWMIDLLTEPSRAYVGRHDDFTGEKGERVGLPVPPRELSRLMGLEELPPFEAGGAASQRDGTGGGYRCPEPVGLVGVPARRRGACGSDPTPEPGGSGVAGGNAGELHPC
ncbi:hypothetical protein ABWH91_09670 [Phycisphaerales bacterium ac7]